MKRMLAGFVVTGLLVAGAATAQETVRYSWDGCDPPVVNKDFAAAGNYLQVISGIGFDALYKGQQVEIILGPGQAVPFPDAWRFDLTGCQTGQLNNTSISTAGFSKACPQFQVGQPLTLFQFLFGQLGDPPNTAHLSMANTFDTFDGLGATRYTFWQVTWNHAFSLTGPQDPQVACGHAETPMCFYIQNTYVLDENNIQRTVNNYEQRFVTWGDAGNAIGCPSVPNRPTTWGQIKNQYIH